MTHRQLYAPRRSYELDAKFDKLDNDHDDATLSQIMQMWQNARTVDDSEDAFRLLERWQDRRYGHILPKW